MPLFGPNVKKMKEDRDSEGLIKVLKSSNARVRIEATKALSELNDVEGLAAALQNNDIKVRIEATQALKNIQDNEGVERLIRILTAPLRFGNDEDRIEAITLIQGRVSSMFLLATLGLRAEALEKALDQEKLQKKLDVKLVRPALSGTAKDRKGNSVVRWYALTALAELGDRSDEVAQLLIETAEILLTLCKRQDIGSQIAGFALEDGIQKETLRALSYFAGSGKVRDALIDALQGHRFVGYQHISSPWSYAVYALSAFGDPSAREHLEYWAMHGDEMARRRAQVALELFGKTTFDEVQAKVKAEFGID